ncbi:MAG: hypothetical protein HXY25_05810, partial [Alphaproteobacteria bacterium]|nr:hypothetical protein [Alphaproteobacteria bacterium]
ALDLIARRVAEAVRAAAAGEGETGPLPPRVLAGGLDVWVEVWETLNRLRRTVAGLHLDRAAALLLAFDMMAGAAEGRRPGAVLPELA